MKSSGVGSASTIADRGLLAVLVSTSSLSEKDLLIEDSSLAVIKVLSLELSSLIDPRPIKSSLSRLGIEPARLIVGV